MRFTIKNLYWIDLAILGLTLIVTLMGIGNYGLYEPHEGHFAMVGQEMLWRNDWVTPHLNGAPYLNKPPLLYWLTAISTKIFGSSEFAARLPIALSGWLGIIIAWKWSRELWGINSSRITALMLSVTLGWFIFTHQILIDVLLGTLLLSCNYFLWRSLYQPRSWLNWSGTYISLALCVLTKGIIGAIFPVVGCVVLIVLRQDWKIIKRIRLYQGLLLVIALLLPWSIAIERANPGFWHYFIVNEHLDRIFDRRFPPDYEVSKISGWGYLAITACWCFPWVLFLPSVIKSTWQEWQQGLFNNASILDRKNSDGILLLSMGAILPVIVFLPLASRLIYYSIPAIPAYIILCAGWWDKYSRQQLNQNLASTRIDYCFPVNPNLGSTIPVGTMCQTTVKTIPCAVRAKKLNLYGLLAVVLSLICYGAIALIPQIFDLLPIPLQTAEVVRLIIVVAIALGTGWLVSAIGMFKASPHAWIPLVIVFAIAYIGVIKGFVLYQDLRSSKDIVQQADYCLSNDTVWIFEGSREIGAAGAISYYLNQQGHSDSNYRTVKVLAEGGNNRLPPQFPGEVPEYLITRQQVQDYWNSKLPTVFLTDFLRQPNDQNDPLTLNLPQPDASAYLISGQRRLYLNQTAQNLAQQKCSPLSLSK